MTELLSYLKHAVEQQASDLFIVAGAPVCAKMDNKTLPVGKERLLPADTQRLIAAVYQVANRNPERYFKQGDDDFSFSVPNLARFRVNAYRQRGSLAAVIRVVNFRTGSRCGFRSR